MRKLFSRLALALALIAAPAVIAQATTPDQRVLLFSGGIKPVAALDMKAQAYTGRCASFAACITASRADASARATYVNSSGVVTTVASAADARFNYDLSTLAARGYLSEGAATNYLLRSGDIGNASWTLKTSATVTSNYATGVLGTATAARLQISAAVDGFVGQQITWTNGQTGTFSCYIKSNTGASQTLRVRLFDGANTFYRPVTVTTSWQRFYVTATAATTATANVLLRSPDTFTAVDVVVDACQFELTAFPTSYLSTAGSSVARAADTHTAAALTSNPAIMQYRSVSTGTRARKVLTTFSAISSEQNLEIEAIRIYPVGTTSAWLNAHLTVDGPWQ